MVGEGCKGLVVETELGEAEALVVDEVGKGSWLADELGDFHGFLAVAGLDVDYLGYLHVLVQEGDLVDLVAEAVSFSVLPD